MFLLSLDNGFAHSWFLVVFFSFILGYLLLLNVFIILIAGSASYWSSSLSSFDLNFFSFRTKNLGYFVVLGFLGLPPLFFFFNKLMFLSFMIKNLGHWSFIFSGGLVFFLWSVYFKFFKIIFKSANRTLDQPFQAQNAPALYFFLLVLGFLYFFGLSFFIEDFFLWIVWTFHL